MKISIIFPVKDAATGGGNQFIKMLKHNLQKRGLYAETDKADIVLFNSHQYIKDVVKAKRSYPNKIFIHRIDGPMKLYNKPEDMRDNIVRLVNEWISDGNVYQSNWSRERNYEFGMKKMPYEITVCNVADNSIFNLDGKCKFDRNRKTKLIATSWSNNMNKGFDTYKYLDETLDWNKYEMTFVGNSPVEFKNIVHKPPMKSIDLAKELKQHDIYISASRKDPCSNSVIEALSCGLPALCLNDGGHPELVKEGGLLFKHWEEILGLLEKIVNNYEWYQQNIEIFPMDTVVDEYIDLAEKLKKSVETGKYMPKKIGYFRAKYIAWRVRRWGG